MSKDVHRCHRGHAKELRSYGWYCVQCEAINRHARHDEQSKQGKRPPRGVGPGCKSKAVATTQLCKRGHYRVILPGGRRSCPECKKRYARARRAFVRAKSCEHLDEPGFEGVMNKQGIMVCLACVAAELGAA